MANAATSPLRLKGDLEIDQPLPVTEEELDASWFSSIMDQREVAAVKVIERIHSTSSKILIELTYASEQDAAPAHVCVKGGFNKALIQQQPMLIDVYRVECGFFYHLAPRLSMRIPLSYWSTTDTAGQGLVVMQDLKAAGYSFGEVLQPWTVPRVQRGLEQLAHLHAKTWGAKQEDHPWLLETSGIRPLLLKLCSVEAWKQRFEGDPHDRPPVPGTLAHRELVEAGFKALWQATDHRFRCIVHGDPHVGNTFITSEGEPGFLDWQGLHIGSAFHDVAYFIVGALKIEDRLKYERDLVGQYLEALHTEGGPRFVVEEVWQEYRMQQFHGIAWALATPAMQPVENIRVMTLRHCSAIVDHETMELLKKTPKWGQEWTRS